MPSTRLSGLGSNATEIAKRRNTDPASLARELRGDLDWVTLKAMEKDRTAATRRPQNSPRTFPAI